jgi:hypothetical protein
LALFAASSAGAAPPQVSLRTRSWVLPADPAAARAPLFDCRHRQLVVLLGRPAGPELKAALAERGLVIRRASGAARTWRRSTPAPIGPTSR